MITSILVPGSLCILILIIAGCSPAEPATNTTGTGATIMDTTAAEAVTAAAVQETVPPVTEPVPEPMAEATPTAAEEIVPPETSSHIIIPEETGETHTVNLIDGGFEVPEITIKAGDTIVWQNVREKNPVKALIVAPQPCAKIKSPIFLPGSSFKWKFEEPIRCTIIDGIFTTQAMKVVVE